MRTSPEGARAPAPRHRLLLVPRRAVLALPQGSWTPRPRQPTLGRGHDLGPVAGGLLAAGRTGDLDVVEHHADRLRATTKILRGSSSRWSVNHWRVALETPITDVTEPVEQHRQRCARVGQPAPGERRHPELVGALFKRCDRPTVRGCCEELLDATSPTATTLITPDRTRPEKLFDTWRVPTGARWSRGSGGR